MFGINQFQSVLKDSVIKFVNYSYYLNLLVIGDLVIEPEKSKVVEAADNADDIAVD